MNKAFFPFIISLYLLLCGSALMAQEVLLMTSETLDSKAKSTINRMYLKNDMVMVESDDKDLPFLTLYDAKKEEMYLIDHKKKEYYVMNKEDLAALNAQMKAGMQQLEQQLKMMPESQRKMMEEQMQKVMGIQGAITYEKESASVPVKNWKSTKYVGKSNDKLRYEVYVVSYKDLGESKDKFKALISMFTMLQDYLQEMGRSMPAMMSFSMPSMPGMEEGFPVKTIYYNQQGKPETTSTLNNIEKTTLAADKWQVPANYKQKKFTASPE